MAEGTRSRVMEETVNKVQADQEAMRQELDGVVSAIASLQQSINELIKRSDIGPGNMKKPVGFKSDEGHHGPGSSILGRHKPAPVYLARFNGEHPERWLAHAARYFEFYDIPERDRLTISSFYLDDSAADWYDWLHRHQRICTWEAFTVALLKRFRSTDFEEPEGLLAKLQQTSSVADYRSRFEAISNRTMALPVEFLISCWISGL
ncbi:putative retrotransposon gag domain-containing protein [Helianthus debilis subsp. tardiflorus]